MLLIMGVSVYFCEKCKKTRENPMQMKGVTRKKEKYPLKILGERVTKKLNKEKEDKP